MPTQSASGDAPLLAAQASDSRVLNAATADAALLLAVASDAPLIDASLA